MTDLLINLTAMVIIDLMKNFNEFDMDGRLLRLLIAVHDEGSVTAAAQALDLTQSTVSHGLNRLRSLTVDRLFVPMGRGITPTERADKLVIDARDILDRLAQFCRTEDYDPTKDEQPFTVAATDYEIELIVGPFLRKLRQHARSVQVRVVRTRPDNEWVDLLRSGDVDLVLAPALTSLETDIMQRPVLRDDIDLVYYDPDQRSAPVSLDDYCNADHIVMTSGRIKKTPIDHALSKLGRLRRVSVSLSSFAGVASILRGSDMVALMPERLLDTTFKGLGTCAPPVSTAKVTISAIWHIRNDVSERHRWMRNLIYEA